MSILRKSPEPLSFTRNVAQNWQEFAEQLQWFLEGTESTEKGDKAKIGIMLSHAGKEAREIYKSYRGPPLEMQTSSIKCSKLFGTIARCERTLSMRDTHFGAFSKKTVNRSTRI